MHLQFDAHQDYQLDAVTRTLALFDGQGTGNNAFTLGDELIPNVSLDYWPPLDEDLIANNLQDIQANNGLPAPLELSVNEGPLLEWVNADNWRYPVFTVERETGTGKTYVYLRTIYELRQRHGFTKFIIVVPSIAIYEGVIATFKQTRDHFRALFDNEPVQMLAYDSSQLSQLRNFAASTTAMILVMTVDAFNKKSNVIYKASDKLPGERLPYQFLQDVRPILILDEPQNMESATAKAALRTLQPLCALHYSATHRHPYNLIYRLTPFDAFQRRLVKRIEVWGVQQRDNYNHSLLALHAVKRAGNKITATVRTYIGQSPSVKEDDLTLRPGDDLYQKTSRDEHRQGYVVTEIDVAAQTLTFHNSLTLRQAATEDPNHRQLFETQIRETLQRHFAMQAALRGKDIKVLSLFFIDRVANYTAPDGLIKTLFDRLFNELKAAQPAFQHLDPADVRRAYFAKTKTKSGEEQAIDTTGSTQSERDLERDAFQLIMRDKERLLSFEEPACFIFAHSALKEGWDNPNVFQICTLNQTVSEVKKRQEIGRGLRLCVNQNGERVRDDSANVLTIIANDSYERYASTLQTEYVADGMSEAPPPPANARDRKAQRNDAIFIDTPEFRAFWDKLAVQLRYQFNIDTDALIAASGHRLNRGAFPVPSVTIQRGRYIITRFSLTLLAIENGKARLEITRTDTDDNTVTARRQVAKGDDLSDWWKDRRLKGYLVTALDDASLTFANRETLNLGQTIEHATETGQQAYESLTVVATTTYPVFNLIDRAARDTGLTRATVHRIFQGLDADRKKLIFNNPEGFAGRFIGEIKQALADHLADNLTFIAAETAAPHPLEDLFPPEQAFIRVKSQEANDRALYDWIQLDSDVEKRFLERLKADPQILFFFKFPAKFKIALPKQIGNYNPDWGMVRYDNGTQKAKLHLIRETKGGNDLALLRFPHEKRKILCAIKYFAELGLDYNFTNGEGAWWASKMLQERLQQQTEGQ